MKIRSLSLFAFVALMAGASVVQAAPNSPEPADPELVQIALDAIKAKYFQRLADSEIEAKAVEAILLASDAPGFAACMSAEGRPPDKAISWTKAWLAGQCADRLADKSSPKHGWVGPALSRLVQAIDKDGSIAWMKQFAEPTPQKRAGFGISFSEDAKGARVEAVRDDSPFSGLDLQKGDVITAVDGIPFAGTTLDSMVEAMRGLPGSEGTLLIVRGAEQARTVSAKRRIFEAEKPNLVQSGVAPIIRFKEFTEGTPEDLSALLKAVAGKKETRAIMLDLRGNDGGLFDAVIAVADLFLEKGPIFSDVGQPGNKTNHVAQKGDVLNGLPLYILIDRKTASGAEILAASLQDRGRAVILGETSFKRGSIQSILLLNREIALRLTTSQIIRPNGEPVSGKGVTPDILLPLENVVDWQDEAVQLIESRIAAKSTQAAR